MPIVRSLITRLHTFGWSDTLEYAAAVLLTRLGGRPLRRLANPSLTELHHSAWSTASADELLSKVVPGCAVEELAAEYGAAAKGLEGAYELASLPCPTNWAVGSQTARFIYMYVRLAKPAHIVETGVANGHSSHLILSALERNGSGHLWSIDVRPEAGVLVPDSMRTRWTLTIADPKRVRPSLQHALKEASPLNLFIHDSDHSWLGQTIEYELASRALGPLGVLASDDVDKSYAWIDWCSSANVHGYLLFDGPKAFGLATATNRRVGEDASGIS